MSKPVSRYSRILFALSLLLSSAWLGYSQSTTSLRGTITDAQGAVIPGTVVTLSDMEKGTSRQVVTDAVGDYAFLQMQPGTYAVKVEKPGFSTATVSPGRRSIRQIMSVPASVPGNTAI